MCFTFKYRAEKLVKFCETKLLLLEDLEKMIKIEVPMRKWIPYEIWFSNNARRWAEE